MNHNSILPAFALALALTACGSAKDVEVGPYTVSVIGQNVYHIQDYNTANPAGEEFDADGKLTHSTTARTSTCWWARRKR